MANPKPVQNNPLLWRSCGERAGCLESQGLSLRKMWKSPDSPQRSTWNTRILDPAPDTTIEERCSTWNIVNQRAAPERTL